MDKLYIKTLGCQMNEYDSYIISSLLRKYANIVEVQNMNDANIFILNTCSVREKAKEKVFSELGKWKKIKKKHACIICVGGCVSSLDGEDIFKRASYVDIVFGPQSLYKLPKMINSVLKKKSRLIDLSFSGVKKFNNVFESGNIKNFSSYLTIIEGCNKHCTYCVVPYSRGPEYSRSFNSVISEVYTLVRQGVKELTLLGQNVSSYSGYMNNGNNANLALIISYLNEIKEIGRIKFISSHPEDFSNTLLSVYEKNYKLSRHLHLPVQSGSDAMLKVMGRNYDISSYKYIIARLKQICPNITISTDIIVGFPGESDNDFQNTVNFIRDIYFDMSFVYIYSPRPGTSSYLKNDDVSVELKKKRLSFLNKLFVKQSRLITESMVNSIQRVLVYKRDSSGYLIGKTDNNRVVVINCDTNYIGCMITVKISKKIGLNLIGKLVEYI